MCTDFAPIWVNGPDVALHIERRGFLHFMWRYHMEVHGSLSQLILPKMNAEVSVRA
jgi:hypothetical protein